MRPVKPSIEPLELFGKDHYIPTVGLCDEGNSIHVNEIPRSRQGDSHTITRVGAVGDDVLPLHLRHAWVLYPEFLIGGKESVSRRCQKRLWGGRKVESVGTACQSNDRSSRSEMGAEKHGVLILMLNYRRIVNGFHWIRDLGFGKDRILAVSSDNVRRHDRFFASSSKTVEYTCSYASTIVSIEKHCW